MSPLVAAASGGRCQVVAQVWEYSIPALARCHLMGGKGGREAVLDDAAVLSIQDNTRGNGPRAKPTIGCVINIASNKPTKREMKMN